MAEKDYTTKIKIEGDSKGAESAISGAGRALSGLWQSALRISRTIGQALSVFSRLTWIVQSFQLLIDGFKKLNQWIHSSETAARELADTMERTAIAAQSALSADAYKKLNKELDEANRLERQRNEILTQRKNIARDLEDANIALSREREIAELDPESKTYAKDKAAIERRYSLMGAETSMNRTIEDSRDEVARLYSEANRLDAQAAEKEKAYNRQNAIVERGVERAFRLDREARAVDPDDEEEKKAAEDRAKEAERQWRADNEAAQKMKESMDALRKEAEALRAKAANMPGGVAARKNFEVAQLRASNQERAEAAAETAKLKATDEEQKRSVEEFSRGLEKKASEDAWKRAFEAASPTEKVQMLQEREASASTDMAALRAALDAEMQKDVRDRDAKRIAELKSGIGDAQGRMLDAQGDRERMDLQARQTFAGNATDAFLALQPSGNRLTAMGLGAGTGVDRLQTQMLESLKSLVNLGQQQVDVLREMESTSDAAVYGD